MFFLFEREESNYRKKPRDIVSEACCSNMFFPQTYTDDVPNRVANVIIVTSVGTGIALLFMGARILVKMRMTRLGLTLDDWLLFAAMVRSIKIWPALSFWMKIIVCADNDTLYI